MELYLKISKLEVTILGECAEIKFNNNIVFERVGKLFLLSNEVN